MSILTRTDVTAVKIFNKYILAGIGSSLEIFDIDSGKFINRISILNGQKIYGIEAKNGELKFLIFGGKQFSILELLLDDGVSSKRQSIPVVSDDWLHSGKWISEEEVALLTAHNVVQIWHTEKQLLLKQHISGNNSILYSGLLLPLADDLLVFSGTVFSEVIVQGRYNEPLHSLKGHKGVIFSITYNAEKDIIVTTSDDRSVIIWTVTGLCDQKNTINYWKNAQINCTNKLYGHMARVMRSFITNDLVISIGEDSRICFWNHQGKLLRKILSHQNSCIWSLDVNSRYLVTGGGDSGIIRHPLSLVSEYGQKDIILVDINKPKKVAFTARQNLVILNEENNLVYHNLDSNTQTSYILSHTSTYKLLSVSSCKQIIAIADMNGKLDIFIEICKNDAVLNKIIDTNLSLGKILSMHWAANRHLVVCSDNGALNILTSKDNGVENIETFCLPNSKERWLTSCALSLDRNALVASDRCGHIHVYFKGTKNPIKTFNRVYNRYGATSIIIKDNQIITTGRDGTIKYFSLSKISEQIKYKTSINLDFQWLEKFLDDKGKYVCGFHERAFVVYDVRRNFKVLETACGGGHRSWDAIRYIKKINDEFKEIIKVIYVKNSTLHSETFQLSKIMSKNIIDGIHSKEINCLKSYKLGGSFDVFFTGGEDTTLRISSTDYEQFKDEVVFKNLSSIRTIKIIPLDKNKLLLISGGGRAKICAKIITFEIDNEIIVNTEDIIDYMIKGTDKERKGNKTWRDCTIDFDPETRIMDLEAIGDDNANFTIFSACSDAILRIYKINIEISTIVLIKEIDYHKVCILKTKIFKFNTKNMLATCTTRGDVAFWEITDEISEPIFKIKTNKSGINTVDVKTLDKDKILLGTAGDDNAIHLNLIEIENGTFKVKNSWLSDQYHCSQITGLKLIGDLMLTTSIDQRVTLFVLGLIDGVECDFYSQHFSDVADVHGLEVVEVLEDSITVCVFGKGLEIVRIPRPGK